MNQEEIALTDGEFDLLWVLATHAEKTLSREWLTYFTQDMAEFKPRLANPCRGVIHRNRACCRTIHNGKERIFAMTGPQPVAWLVQRHPEPNRDR